MAAFGAKLRALRQAKGLLQKTLAIELGVHQTFLSNVEKGHRVPANGPEFVAKVAAALDLTATEAAALKDALNESRFVSGYTSSPEQLDLMTQISRVVRQLPSSQTRALRDFLTAWEDSPGGGVGWKKKPDPGGEVRPP